MTVEIVSSREAMTVDMVVQAVTLVNIFYAENLMLEASIDHYAELAREGRLVVAVDGSGEVVGTVGFTVDYGDTLELGGWAVKSSLQSQGVGVALLDALLAQGNGSKVIAFANANSEPIFTKLGAVKITDLSEIPEKALELCQTCPAKPVHGCCDTILDLTPILKKDVGEERC